MGEYATRKVNTEEWLYLTRRVMLKSTKLLSKAGVYI